MRVAFSALCTWGMLFLVGCAEPALVWKDPETVGDEGGRVLPCSEVEPGVLYRSGQPGPKELKELAETIGIKTIVNARGGPRKNGWYRTEAEFAKKHGIKLVNMDVDIVDTPTPEQQKQFLDLIRNPENHPILVHCRWGMHRTGHLVRVFLNHRDEVVKKETKSAAPAPKMPA